MSSFRLALSGENRRQFKELCEIQAEQGSLDSFLVGAKQLMRGLEDDPVGTGELRFRLPNSGLLACIAAHAPLCVRYGVDEASRIVYIKDFTLMG